MDEMELQSNIYFDKISANSNKSVMEEVNLIHLNKRLSIEVPKDLESKYLLCEDEDISKLKQLSLLTAGARYQLLNVNQQLVNFGIMNSNVI